ncbi:MAG: cysteine hydrolase family protein [Candidatus Dormibacteria bacterium]
MKAFPHQAALIVVDVQRAFDNPRWGTRNNPEAEANVARLLAGWRRSGRLVIHVHHRNSDPAGLFAAGQPGFEVKPEAQPQPGETVLQKEVNSGFIGTDLEQRLRDAGITHLVICGLTTDHCVSTTARMSANLGFATFIAADATATFDRTGPDGRHWPSEEMHQSALASLHQEFATIGDTASTLEGLGAEPDPGGVPVYDNAGATGQSPRSS